MIRIGAACASVVIVGGLIALARKKRAQLQAIMVMLLTEVCSPWPTGQGLALGH
jgi:hypothetical protein